MRDFFARQRENLTANLVASAIFAIIAGVIAWLSDAKPIQVPAWLFVAVAAIVVGWWWLSRPRKKLVAALNESFGVERVSLDGKHFVNCKFNGSELVFSGKQGFSLERCEFISHHLRFEGSAATVLAVLTAMYKEPGFRQAIDSTLNQVRSHGNL